jgi:hypothetical protein
LNVRYVVSPVELISDRLKPEASFQVNSDQPLRLYRLTSFLGRAMVIRPGTIPPEVINLPKSNALAVRRTNQERAGIFSLGKALEGTSAKVSEHASGDVELNVESPQDGLVVLLDNNYPGWVARVDGEVRQIQAIHPVCKVVAVPKGKHQVTFSFESASFRLGLMISVAAVSLVFTTLAACLFKTRSTIAP